MTQKISPRSYGLRSLWWFAEQIFCLVVPIYLYGWLVGLLVYSGLSSLLHIAGLLCGMAPRYLIVNKDGLVMDNQTEILKLMKEK